LSKKESCSEQICLLPACADPCFHPIFFCFAIGRDDDGAAGAVLGNFRDELGVFLERTRRFAVNREINQRGSCHHAFAFSPKLFQFAVGLSHLDREA